MYTMPKETKAEKQAALASLMELYFATSLATQEDSDMLSDMQTNEEEKHSVEDGAYSDIFEILAVQVMQDVQEMSGDASQGPYGQQSRSKDWFSASLSSFDHDFHRIFRYVILQYLRPNLI